MKKVFCLAIVLAISVNINTFSANKKPSGKRSNTSSTQINSKAPQVALKFITEYTQVLKNYSSDLDSAYRNHDDRYSYLETSNLITKRFKNELLEKIVKDYAVASNSKTDPVLGLQDFDTEWKIVSYNFKNGNVLLQGPTFKVKVKVKNVNGKWLVDNSGF